MIAARLAAAIGVAALAPAAAAAPGAPPAAAEVSLTERVGAPIPLDLPFTTSARAAVRLGDVLLPGKPTLLVLAYARCTMLCNVVLRGVVEVARALPLEPGRDYALVVVGLDHRETPDEAARTQAALLAELGRGPDRARWPYLVGGEASVRALAAALGFGYAWDPVSEQYAHPAVIFALAPDGRVAGYLHGARFAPADVLAALAGAAGDADAAELLRCFRFDPAYAGRRARAQRVIQVGAAVVFFLLAGGVLALVAWERRRRRR